MPAVAAAAFAVAGAVARAGCPCEPEKAGGIGAAGAVAAHRIMEGSVLAVGGSLTTAAALAVHALAEGLAVGALLSGQQRRSRAAWLALMCLGPLAGAWVLEAARLPVAATSLVPAFAAGVLLQAARVSVRAASHRGPPGRMLAVHHGAAALLAAVVTAVAVLGAG
ncbi:MULTISPECIES: hypothetical protein [Streptomycetaceae]|uniref:hypothetical protein n=1 Tax=Streptomycetaceae TaxID=2062 RepID=UPI0003FCA960|nr:MULTISPECIES: hypothetical protein [Streptomycetaceae]